MSKETFLKTLREKLSFLPQEDLEERLAFYGEMIDDRIEEGMTEEEAAAAIGTAEEIAEQVMSEIPLSKLVIKKMKPKRKLRTWEIVLLALGSPVWIPLLAAAAVVLICVYAVIWTIVICIYAVTVSFAGGAVLSVPGAVQYISRGNLPGAVFVLGAGIFLAGLSILMIFVSIWITKKAAKITSRLLLWIKSLFIRKENKES
ncbi:MAG: DUF1700 domain-containing protein [Parasporobacterium sp.]|nr:DUF1700 domain-containing protein [Parasporobacterium sp.]